MEALKEAKDVLGLESLWWRGHLNEAWSLQAGVFRSGTGHEQDLIGHFRMRACGRLGHRKEPESDLQWLFLAQHYGLATRLLDWSQSALAALYFAVENKVHDASNGCLWALSPTKLNALVTNDSFPWLADLHDLGVEDMVAQAFDNRKISASTPLPGIALATRDMDERMVAQSSAFTLHTTTTGIENIKDQACVHKFFIPAGTSSRSARSWTGSEFDGGTSFPTYQP